MGLPSASSLTLPHWWTKITVSSAPRDPPSNSPRHPQISIKHTVHILNPTLSMRQPMALGSYLDGGQRHSESRSGFSWFHKTTLKTRSKVAQDSRGLRGKGLLFWHLWPLHHLGRQPQTLREGPWVPLRVWCMQPDERAQTPSQRLSTEKTRGQRC